MVGPVTPNVTYAQPDYCWKSFSATLRKIRDVGPFCTFTVFRKKVRFVTFPVLDKCCNVKLKVI